MKETKFKKLSVSPAHRKKHYPFTEQQLSGEDLAKHLAGQPVPPPESPPFILPPKEEEEGQEKSGGAGSAAGAGGGGKKAAKAKSQGAGAKQQHSAAPPPPPPPQGPPVPPITIETIVTLDDTDGDVDFVDGINAETGSAERRFGFHVQRLRVRSSDAGGQPRRLAVSALATPGSHSPGGPFAKEAPRVMQRALLQLDSPEDFEKVVLGLRAAEEVSATRRATRAALERRRVEGLRARRRRDEARAESMRALSAILGMRVTRSLEGEGELEVPPVRPLVLECAR